MSELPFEMEIEKLNQSKRVQTQLTSDSPFFFGDTDKSEIVKKNNGFVDWLLTHKLGVATGFVFLIAVVVVGVIII